MKIGVTGTGSLIGQAIIKCLKKSKYSEIEITGFDYFTDTIGSYWCQNNYLLPDIYKDPSKEIEWLEKIIEVLANGRIDFLFIGVDFELSLFAKHKDYIEAKTNTKIVISSESVIEIGNDKYKTYEFLKENGFYYPATIKYEGIVPKDIIYPVIVKPAVGARSRGVYIVSSHSDLVEKSVTIENPIIQELVGNDENEYTCGVLMLDNKFISSIVLRRTLKEGNTSKSYYSKDYPEIIDQYIKQIAEKLNPFGSCNLQLRLDIDGIPKLFEINPRHSGTTYMRTLFGYNEIEMILDYFITGHTDIPVLQPGMAIRYFEEMYIN